MPNLAHATRHGHGFHQIEMYRLIFSAEQNKKLDTSIASVRQDLPPLFKGLRSERLKLNALLKSNEAKDSDIKTQIDKISEIQYQRALKKAAIIRSIRKIASPEQLAKVDALEAKHLKHREQFIEAMRTLNEKAQDN